MLSTLPAKIIKLLEIIGFNGNKVSKRKVFIYLKKLKLYQKISFWQLKKKAHFFLALLPFVYSTI